MKTLHLCAVLISVGILSVGAADPDTPQTRRREAERYLQAVPPKEMFEDMMDKLSAQYPVEQRAAFKAAVMSHLDIPALTKAMTDASVKHFTTEELKAMNDFYGSPVGKSIMKKFGNYMADLMPAIQAQIRKAQPTAPQTAPSAPSP